MYLSSDYLVVNVNSTAALIVRVVIMIIRNSKGRRQIYNLRKFGGIF